MSKTKRRNKSGKRRQPRVGGIPSGQIKTLPINSFSGQVPIANVKSKKKLLYYSDINEATGFGQIGLNILPKLYETGKYEMVGIGVNYHGSRHRYPFHIYSLDSSDVYGYKSVADIIREENPDVVFMLQDLFVIKEHMKQKAEKFPNIPVIGYFPIDGNNIPEDWRRTIDEFELPICYSEYGRNTVLKAMPHLKDKLQMVYHGIDTDLFKILPDEQKLAMRQQNKVHDKFLIGVFNRFQPRKMIPLLMRAILMVNDGYKICEQCGHYFLRHHESCDLNETHVGVSKEVEGRGNVMGYFHCNQIEPSMGGPLNSLGACLWSLIGKTNHPAIGLQGRNIYSGQAPSHREVVALYNMCHMYITATIGEGFGLTAAEALSCGLHVAVPNNTTGPEIIGKHGDLIDCVGHLHLPYDTGHQRHLVDINAMVDSIQKYYELWKADKLTPNVAGRQYIKETFRWDNAVKRFDQYITEVLDGKYKKEDIKVVSI